MIYKNTLETQRLILRPLTDDDFEAVYSWAGVKQKTNLFISRQTKSPFEKRDSFA